MVYIIDVGPIGEIHFVNTDPGSGLLVADPLRSDTQVDILTMLSHMKDRPDLREAGGWHVVNQLEGEDKPLTRWDRLLKAVRESGDVKDKEALR